MVSKEKELELINTIREMLKNGDSEEDIITIFEGFGLDKEYVSELIDKAKGKKRFMILFLCNKWKIPKYLKRHKNFKLL